MSPQTPLQRERQEALNWLIEYFPATFFQTAKQVKPLKLGIFEDIIDFYDRLEMPPCSKKILKEAINYYSASKAYLSCQKENSARVDIYGIEVDVVTAEQAQYAQERFKQRFSNYKQTTTGEKND